eukprot:scaffold31067_cov45-Cyclotella_meneghiniana.AAC.1
MMTSGLYGDSPFLIERRMIIWPASSIILRGLGGEYRDSLTNGTLSMHNGNGAWGMGPTTRHVGTGRGAHCAPLLDSEEGRKSRGKPIL